MKKKVVEVGKWNRWVISFLKIISNKKIALYIFIFLITFNLVLGGLNIAKVKGMFIPAQPPQIVNNNIIDLDDLTLEQKIAQMIIVIGTVSGSEPFRKMQVGGFHLHAMNSEEQFKRVVNTYQQGMEIPFFVTVDLEGCVSPFASFKTFQSANEIDSLGRSFEKGKLEGKYLSSLGVSINFAPVVDLEDQIWQCRSFLGDKDQITELANSYILGLQDENIIATAKHYPGKTLVIKDPHKYLAAAEITADDLYPYKSLAEKKTVQAIMVSHLITYGLINSEGKPSVASKKIIDDLRSYFDGLIITDEINMLGVKSFYNNVDEMYLDVFKAGSDIILNFNDDPNEIYRLIQLIKTAVEEGEIDEDRIDDSVRKIFEAKGFIVE